MSFWLAGDFEPSKYAGGQLLLKYAGLRIAVEFDAAWSGHLGRGSFIRIIDHYVIKSQASCLAMGGLVP